MSVNYLKEADFDDKVQNTSKLMVVDFFATWCGPCRMLEPLLMKAAQAEPEVDFYKVDIDKEEELAAKFRIMTVPTLLFIKNGEIVEKSVGVISERDMMSIIKRHQ